MNIILKIKRFIPLIIDIIVSIITLIVYSLTSEKLEFLVYLQICIGPIVLLALELLNKTKLIRIPLFVTAIITSHLIIALDLGSALNFYDKIGCWDLIAHGYFGFVASFLVLTVLLNFNGDKLKFILLLGIILFIVIGFGGFWEIIEFTCDAVLDLDSQRIEESIALGHTPVWDTMMDLIITVPGVLSFWLVMMIDQYFGGKLYNHLLLNSKKIEKQNISSVEETN